MQRIGQQQQQQQGGGANDNDNKDSPGNLFTGNSSVLAATEVESKGVNDVSRNLFQDPPKDSPINHLLFGRANSHETSSSHLSRQTTPLPAPDSASRGNKRHGVSPTSTSSILSNSHVKSRSLHGLSPAPSDPDIRGVFAENPFVNDSGCRHIVSALEHKKIPKELLSTCLQLNRPGATTEEIQMAMAAKKVLITLIKLAQVLSENPVPKDPKSVTGIGQSHRIKEVYSTVSKSILNELHMACSNLGELLVVPFNTLSRKSGPWFSQIKDNADPQLSSSNAFKVAVAALACNRLEMREAAKCVLFHPITKSLKSLCETVITCDQKMVTTNSKRTDPFIRQNLYSPSRASLTPSEARSHSQAELDGMPEIDHNNVFFVELMGPDLMAFLAKNKIEFKDAIAHEGDNSKIVDVFNAKLYEKCKEFGINWFTIPRICRMGIVDNYNNLLKKDGSVAKIKLINIIFGNLFKEYKNIHYLLKLTCRVLGLDNYTLVIDDTVKATIIKVTFTKEGATDTEVSLPIEEICLMDSKELTTLFDLLSDEMKTKFNAILIELFKDLNNADIPKKAIGYLVALNCSNLDPSSYTLTINDINKSVAIKIISTTKFGLQSTSYLTLPMNAIELMDLDKLEKLFNLLSNEMKIKLFNLFSEEMKTKLITNSITGELKQSYTDYCDTPSLPPYFYTRDHPIISIDGDDRLLENIPAFNAILTILRTSLKALGMNTECQVKFTLKRGERGHMGGQSANNRPNYFWTLTVLANVQIGSPQQYSSWVTLNVIFDQLDGNRIEMKGMPTCELVKLPFCDFLRHYDEAQISSIKTMADFKQPLPKISLSFPGAVKFDANPNWESDGFTRDQSSAQNLFNPGSLEFETRLSGDGISSELYHKTVLKINDAPEQIWSTSQRMLFHECRSYFWAMIQTEQESVRTILIKNLSMISPLVSAYLENSKSLKHCAFLHALDSLSERFPDKFKALTQENIEQVHEFIMKVIL